MTTAELSALVRAAQRRIAVSASRDADFAPIIRPSFPVHDERLAPAGCCDFCGEPGMIKKLTNGRHACDSCMGFAWPEAEESDIERARRLA